MKAIIIIIPITLFTNLVVAQQTLDTIYANDKKNVALFFPEPIRQGITGTSNFVFTYNREKEQYFGLLQATPGTESNLLTVTKNGQVYSYILKYKEQLPKLNYFISLKESIGYERPLVLKQKPISQPHSRIDYFKKFSNHLLKSNSGHIATKRKKGIKLQLQKMVYNASEVYLVLEIKNKSEIDFEVDYLNIFRMNGNKKRKASYQKLLIQVDYEHEMPKSIKVGESHRLVYVLPKFVLGDDERFMIELQEIKGSRKVNLLAKS
ncbi:hypothetical protein MTsPCn9_25390 [Croceitalea sp. MTPC9]|uniref:DUF4138 domain-containing protein n=1 Tax=unclassified Croceitalea TaxID=2632280 RepID=UPI002B3BB63B|nr:hypothetical protein MTsPCn6_29140 [Croceitalea sp. MTPC6]GMN17601.1 hypothetical protein MTsPCn9_25390 [Croceitalea sp. MTPC9]